MVQMFSLVCTVLQDRARLLETATNSVEVLVMIAVAVFVNFTVSVSVRVATMEVGVLVRVLVVVCALCAWRVLVKLPPFCVLQDALPSTSWVLRFGQLSLVASNASDEGMVVFTLEH